MLRDSRSRVRRTRAGGIGVTWRRWFGSMMLFLRYVVLNLLNTRDGDYAAACSMDYSKPPAYYDTFALRDIEGYEAVTSTFPYFRSKVSRQAMISGQPVPVQSCWNGMGISSSFHLHFPCLHRANTAETTGRADKDPISLQNNVADIPHQYPSTPNHSQPSTRSPSAARPTPSQPSTSKPPNAASSTSTTL